MSPKDCIVEDVVINCHREYPPSPFQTASAAVTTQHRPFGGFRRSRRALACPVPNALEVGTPLLRSDGGGGGGGSESLLSIQFHFGTRISEAGGEWPDEFHRASDRLFSMFDHFEQQLEAGGFSVLPAAARAGRGRMDGAMDEMEHVAESATYTFVKAVCDIGHTFNDTILLCGLYHNQLLNNVHFSKLSH